MTTESLAPWLSTSRWPTVPIRFVAKLGTGHTPSRNTRKYWEDCTVPWITLADVWQIRNSGLDYISKTKEMVSLLGLANSSAVKHPAGTVILSRTASVGFSAIMSADMATSQDFATWTCSPSLEPKFLLHALRAMAPDLKRVAAGSTHKTIYMPDIEGLRIPFPSTEEQRRIATFLDAETSRIAKVISIREQQLSLFTDRENTLILQSVAGHAEPEPRKLSQLAWLGTVPESWPLTTVSQQYEVLLGKMLNPERSKGEHLRPYLRNANVRWDHIDTNNLVEMNFPPEERARFRVEPGDLMICEGGQPGRCAIWNEPGREIYYQKALHRVRPRSYSSNRWLFYCMKAATSQNVFAVEGNSTTSAHLTGEQLRTHRFPFPEESIQNRVTEKLDEWTAYNRSCTKKIQEQLALLAERRQALITAAVTGQIDVSTASGRGVDLP